MVHKGVLYPINKKWIAITPVPVDLPPRRHRRKKVKKPPPRAWDYTFG
jgi:hypothetical protein